MKKHFLAIAVFVAGLMGSMATAQVSHGGAPIFNHAKGEVKNLTLSTIDNQRYIQEDMDLVKGGSPMRIGVVQEAHLSNLTGGSKTILADGSSVWRASVTSPGATFMSLTFSTFDIPEGAELYLYDQSGDFIIGRFLRQDAKEDGGFYTQAIPGSTVFIEYHEPANVAGQGVIELSDVCHGYKDLFNDNLDDKGYIGDAEGSCHVNIKCHAADDWRDEVRSVVAYTMVAGGYSYICSGALVNNTNQDRKPYVLSAHHCQDNGTVTQWCFYFLYNTTTCTGVNGPHNKTLTGATIRAKNGATASNGSDFLLVELSQPVPDSYTPYYAGWERMNATNAGRGVCIHHPGGDYKKISFAKKLTRQSGGYAGFYKAEWYISNDTTGVTEQGSSGSPIFNEDHRIIGQLYAGTSACDYTAGTDYYGRVYTSWTGGGSNATRLSNWLDPAGQDPEYVDGLDYKDPEVGIDGPDAEAAQLTIYPNPSKGMVYLDVNAIGMAQYNVYDLNGRCVLQGHTILTSTAQGVNLSKLAAGAYTLQLNIDGRSYSAPVIIRK